MLMKRPKPPGSMSDSSFYGRLAAQAAGKALEAAFPGKAQSCSLRAWGSQLHRHLLLI